MGACSQPTCFAPLSIPAAVLSRPSLRTRICRCSGVSPASLQGDAMQKEGLAAANFTCAKTMGSGQHGAVATFHADIFVFREGCLKNLELIREKGL